MRSLRRTAAYRGRDRRGIIGRPEERATGGRALILAGAMIALPLLGVGLASLFPEIDDVSWSTGALDAAFVAYVIVSVVLAFRWRLLGEAACVSYLAASVLSAVLVLATTHWTDPADYMTAVRAASLLGLLGLCVDACRAPDVRAGLRPERVVLAALCGALGLAALLWSPPARIAVVGTVHGYVVSAVGEAVVCFVLAGTLLVVGVRRRRTLHVAVGGALLSPGMACAAGIRAYEPAGVPWIVLPPIALVVGAVALLALIAGDTKALVSTVVLPDARGRRRWEAAESELTEVRHGYQDQRHDVKSVLSAIDGTLLVLSRQRRGQLPEKGDEDLIAAVREQVRWLQALYVGDDCRTQTYNLSELVSAIVAVRSAGRSQPSCTLEADLEVHGRPDRLAMVIHNLLANAAAHAPGAKVAIRAGRHADEHQMEGIEITVSDDGPGIPEADIEHALRRGWRRAERAKGHGLRLFQCRRMIEEEGGTLLLGPTDAGAEEGHRGLTVRLRLPGRRGYADFERNVAVAAASEAERH